MNITTVWQYALFLLIIFALVKPLGTYMARVFTGESTVCDPVLKPLERTLYRLAGINPRQDMGWEEYAGAFLWFSLVGTLLLYSLLRLQIHLPSYPPLSALLPSDPAHPTTPLTPDLAANTAISFSTTSTWQAYGGETTMSYVSQMVGLTAQNFLAAAAGLAVGVAFIRGLVREKTSRLGNFWVDMTRAVLWILLPLAIVGALVLVWEGVPSNLNPYTVVTTREGATQIIAQGPVAPLEIIKNLGTNGGGFFNANSAHPFENPTPLANLFQMWLIFCIPAALTYTFGKMVGNQKQGWALFGSMAALFLIGTFVCYGAEMHGNPTATTAGHLLIADTGAQPGGNMEGKETRFGIANSALFATVTTDASCGAVNAMHDSFTPIGGMVPLFNIMTGELIFGGVGAGLYGILMYAVVAVFIAGLMVGRTPEYLGKKIEQYEVKMAMLAILVLAASILGFTALSTNLDFPPGSTSVTFTDKQKADEDKLLAKSPNAAWNHVNNSSPSNYYGSAYNNQNNSGAHGLSEILYAYTSSTGNNGSAFAGLTANTPYYNLTLALAMLIGRFLMIIPLLAIAGSMADKKFTPPTSGTFPTDTATFSVLLIGVVIIVGALTFFPALALGPVVEHFQMLGGKAF